MTRGWVHTPPNRGLQSPPDRGPHPLDRALTPWIEDTGNTGIWSMHMWYASYWKSFFLEYNICCTQAAYCLNTMQFSKLFWILFQATSRRMRQFNEVEHAREERRKYQKTAQTLTLFIISYIAQWWAWITFCLWSSFGDPSMYLVSIVKITLTLLSFHTLSYPNTWIFPILNSKFY